MANRYCANCGIQLKENEKFCPVCGAGAENAPGGASPADAARYTDPVTGHYTPPGQVYYTPSAQDAPPSSGAYHYNQYAEEPAQDGKPQEKSGAKTGFLVAGIIAGAAAVIAAIVLALSGGFSGNAGGTGTSVFSGGLFSHTLGDQDLPEVTYSYLTQEKTVDVNFTSSEQIYPNLYSTMDSVVNLTATSEGGDAEAIVKVEIPGFTQPFEQKVMLSEQITKLYIKPALLPGDIDLTSSKDAQIDISVVDSETGKVYAKETRKVKLMSVYDFMLWDDEFGAYSDCDLLAWLTPESEGILALRRNAISLLDDYTDGKINSLGGYQLSGVFDEDAYYLDVIWQVIGMQAAMSEMGMRYNMGSFSMTEGYNQRVLLPDACLASGSGVCVETALIMASAIQSANMHAMIILPPGHAQVAVEDWDRSGDYWLIETTMLPFDVDTDLDSFIIYLDHDGWLDYLADPYGDGSGSCVVLDCDMATQLGLTGFSN